MDLPDVVKQSLKSVNAITRKGAGNKIRRLLGDPLLWLRLFYSDDELTELRQRQEVYDFNEERLRKRRYSLCDESLNTENRAENFERVLKDKSLKDVVHSYRKAIFPELPAKVLREVQASPVATEYNNPVSDISGKLTGVVTDLYDCPSENGGWEGYIVSSAEKHVAVHRFTSSSCICSFPICLGSTVEFCLPGNTPPIVAGLTVIQYIPGSLSKSYAAEYILDLGVRKASSSLEQVMQLPGPLRAILSEQALFSPYQSELLALLHDISNESNEYFPRVARRLGIHESTPNSFLGSLPNKLCVAHNNAQEEADGGNEDVVHFLKLVSILVSTFPDVAFKLSAVLHSCIQLASCFGEEFASEGPSLCKCVILACSKVRHVSDFTPSSNDESSSEPSLQDPLFWVAHHFGTATANSLRDLIPIGLLQENATAIMERRKLENFLPTSSRADSETPGKIQTAICTKLDLSEPRSSSFLIPDGRKLIERKGIVTDLYTTGVGFIVQCRGMGYTGRGLKGFTISHTTTSSLEGVPPTIHLGDTVVFTASNGSPEKVYSVVRINSYCSKALEATFLDTYLSKNQELVKLLENEAAMRGILNAPQVYSSHGMRAKLIETAELALVSSTPSMRKIMLSLLKCSSFIHDLVECAPKEVSRSVGILKSYLEQLPNEVCALSSTLISTVDLLMKQDKAGEVAELMLFLATGTCLLPHSVEIAQQPWQWVSTILTEEECKSGAVANSEYLPSVKDRYISSYEYGRTYFLLLRADCHGQLASHIYHTRQQSLAKMDKDVEVAIYDARLTGFSNHGSGKKLVYHFKISSQPNSSDKTSCDTPLIKSHNLLCLSIGGHFENDIVWAIINHVRSHVHQISTEAGNIRSCDVCLEFCTESNSLSDEEAMLQLRMSANVVALESPAYFRAYQPVLDGLKQMDLEKVHFLPDLLNPSSETQAKLELINDGIVVTDIAGLFKTELEDVPKELTVGHLWEMLTDSKEYTQFCLHRYQRIAVAKALRDSLSLIQGPPGTGKSFIGMTLLRLFLSMKTSSGQLVLENRPALVMAYKNRALDLFVTMCHDGFCSLDSIVRVGHLSDDSKDELKSTLLKERVLSALGRDFTVQYRSALQLQYRKVREAKVELEAAAYIHTLDESLPYLSPEWLQSLIIDQESEVPYDIAAIVRDDPESCLKLLQANQMGLADRELKHGILMVVKTCWMKWVEGVFNLDPTISHHSTSATGLTHYFGADLGYDPGCEMDDDSFEEMNNEIDVLTLSTNTPPQSSVSVDTSNVWKLDLEQRLNLIRDALRERYETAMENFKQRIKQYNLIREQYERKYEKRALCILKKAKIVAMTTTGAAIHQRLLSRLEAPLVIVEEAAEILESNILAVLTPHVKHMVLIGDQKQLRPNVSWSKLCRQRYRFNLSLFERLVRNKYPHTLLLRQNRMHSSLVPLYGYHYQHHGKNDIKSSEKTECLKQPRCMAKNFFWWTYSQEYESRIESSYMNKHEVDMVVTFCCWLICNHVKASIAVLTPYRGQVEEIRQSLETKANSEKRMPVMLRDIDVYTVDEYQGHECDVVILSLVRSNSQGNIGFLGTPNRCVVATSRQKCALYIVGNHAFLEKNSPVLWKKFLERVKEGFPDSVDTCLPVVMANSPATCQSPSQLNEMVQEVLKVAANNTVEGISSNFESSLSLTTCSTPTASQRGVIEAPHSVTSRPAEPAYISAQLLPNIGPVSPHTKRSHSVDSTPTIHRSRERYRSTPAPETMSHTLVATPDSAPATLDCFPEGYHQYFDEDSQPPSQHYPRVPGRQYSIPATIPSPLQPTRLEKSADVEVSSSTDSWDVRQCALQLKTTAAEGKWKFIGRRLKVPEGNIEGIEKNYPNNLEEQFYQMIMRWKSTAGERATKDELIRVLRAEMLNDLAEKLDAQ